MLNKTRKNAGVSEVVGEIILLLIVIPAISVVYYAILSSDFTLPAETVINVRAEVHGRNIVLQHSGGEPVSIDSYILYTINGTTYKKKISDLLSPSAKSNNFWDIGEEINIPFVYDINNLERFNETKIIIIDPSQNMMLFFNVLPMQPMSDIDIEANVYPTVAHIGETITINITVRCTQGDVGVKDLNINCSLPPGLFYIDNQTTKGRYDFSSGVWYIDRLDVGESASLIINTVLNPELKRPFTQMALVLDGSGSIRGSDWKLVREGLANAIENDSIFPHDGSVELTIIQFGGSRPRARVEIGPVVVTEDNYISISNKVRTMSQLKGVTPMSSGILLAADKIFSSPRFNENNRTVICLVTDGLANCIAIPGTYEAEWSGNPWYRDTSEAHSGAACAAAPYITTGWFITRDLDASNASLIVVDFWYKLDNNVWWNIYPGELELYYYDGENYNFVTDLGFNPTKNTWLHYHDVITDPKYFVSNFRIGFRSGLEWEEAWIDDVVIEADRTLLSDGFEGENWNAHWTDPWKEDTERAREYAISLLDMDKDQDEFDCLAVGPYPDVNWLNHSIAWPQPGYVAPPFDKGPGWVTHIDSFSEFENAVKKMFKVILKPIVATFRIQAISGPKDPYIENNEVKIIILPED